jgi:glycosyltransferase involved in cell wall biosynthesis
MLREFGSAITVIRQRNGGHARALNRGFQAATGDYLAKCDADDLWEPRKLERQVDALAADPRIDIAFGAVWIFGLEESRWDVPGAPYGVLDGDAFLRRMYPENLICPSSTLVRRSLYERLGKFAEDLPAEDYDYWFRALRAGAVFHYDPEILVRYRRHDRQITANLLRVRRAAYTVRRWHADLISDRDFVDDVLGNDLYAIGRMLVDEGTRPEARAAFRSSLRRRPTLSAAVWTALLMLPAAQRRTLIDACLAVKHRCLAGASSHA